MPKGVSWGPNPPTWQTLHGKPVCAAKAGSASAGRIHKNAMPSARVPRRATRGPTNARRMAKLTAPGFQEGRSSPEPANTANPPLPAVHSRTDLVTVERGKRRGRVRHISAYPIAVLRSEVEALGQASGSKGPGPFGPPAHRRVLRDCQNRTDVTVKTGHEHLA